MATTTRRKPDSRSNGGRPKASPRPATRDDERAAQAAGGGLDTLLTEASAGAQRRFAPGLPAFKAVARLALRPQRVAARGAGLAAEIARIAVGRSDVAPAKGDRRFKDPAWLGNPAFRRLGQAYLSTVATADKLVCDAELDWADERRVRFSVDNVMDALAPTNFPWTNPGVLKATLDSGGLNFVQGARRFVGDMAFSPRIPSMVDRSKFEVGENLALTPGSIVLKTPVFELIQYKPATRRVRERPMLIVPPMINKFYITDLAPDRSMVQHLVESGQQVFAMSWRNPDARHADWDLDTYVTAVLEAIDAASAIARDVPVHVLGLCAGGITLSAALAHLAAEGEQDKVAGLTLGVCVLDNEHAGTTAAFVDRRVAEAAIADSAQRGYLSGKALAGVFAWLRPNDLVWNYWINNYLMGKEPPAFDILYWNSDATNLPAGLHRDFIDISLNNSLIRAGELEVRGTPVDLSKVTVDSYVVAGIADHITPWQSCYRTTQVLGSEPRFVLSTSGHIAALVNPPGNPKASFRVNEHNPRDADAWLSGAAEKRGTWWDDWAAWLGERSGDERAAPRKLGGHGYEVVGSAPGSYVLQSA